jgi:predicted transcriptional regulator YdeE
MCGADATGFEYMCAVEVGGFGGVPEGTGRLRVGDQRYAVFEHPGHGATLRDTWTAILGWLEGGAYTSAHRPDFEVYPGDTDPVDPPRGLEIWVGVVATTAA